MDVPRSELSDKGGANGPGRRSSSIFVSSIAAFFALFLAPLSVIALVNAFPLGSADVSVLFLAVLAFGSLALAAFGVLGARIGHAAGSAPVVVYGWTVAVVLFLAGAFFGIAAVLHSVA